MSTDLQIANRALFKLGAAPISSFEDQSEEGLAMKEFYRQIRDELMSSYRWNFALARAELVPLARKPLFGFSLQYQLPRDFLRLEQIHNANFRYDLMGYKLSEVKEFSIEGDCILTDIGPTLKIRYLRRVENSELFPPTFVNALTDRLAMEFCEKFTQSNSKLELFAKKYKADIIEAKKNNAIQLAVQSGPDSSVILERL